MAELPHDRYYLRHRATASALAGHTVVVFGVGAIGSLVSEILARNGINLVFVDRDMLDIENLCRHTADPRHVGEPKAIALAKTLNDLVPDEQSFRGVVADIRSLTRDELIDLIVESGAEIVVGSTGEDDIDLELNVVCAELQIPFVIPGLFAADEPLLGEVLFVPWSVDRVAYACFECGRAVPSREDPLPAQPGPIDDGFAIARIAAVIVKSYLLPNSPEGQRLAARVAAGATLTLVGQSGDTARHVRPLQRANCPVCSRARPTRRRQIREAIERALDTLQITPSTTAQRPATPVVRQDVAQDRDVPLQHARDVVRDAVHRMGVAEPVLPELFRRLVPRVASARTQAPRASLSVLTVFFVLVAAGVATWTASCSQLSRISPGARCGADTPYEVLASLRARAALSSSDPAHVIESARVLFDVDPGRKGWSKDAVEAVTHVVQRPQDAAAAATAARSLPDPERATFANAFATTSAIKALGAERSLSLGLSIERTSPLFERRGLTADAEGDIAGALSAFTEAVKLAPTNYALLAEWGFNAKLRALQTNDRDLGLGGQRALVEAWNELGPNELQEYREALRWPIPRSA